jgi:hypothetical protein
MEGTDESHKTIDPTRFKNDPYKASTGLNAKTWQQPIAAESPDYPNAGTAAQSKS